MENFAVSNIVSNFATPNRKQYGSTGIKEFTE
jgi:hypothetical protein